MRPTNIPNLFTDGRNLFTRTKLYESIYGERIIKEGENLFREFSPLRSKLASSMHLGFKPEIKKDDHILYLGASTGTTVTHVSDIAEDGKIYAVEFSPISMIKLMDLSTKRDNLIALLLDASKPETYSPFIDRVDLIYQDIAQPNQINIFLENMDYYGAKRGILMFKTYSIRSEMEVKKELKKLSTKYREMNYKNIERFHKGHYAVFVKS